MNVPAPSRRNDRTRTTAPVFPAPVLLLGLVVAAPCEAQPAARLPDPTFVEKAPLNSRGFAVFYGLPVSFDTEPGVLSNVVSTAKRFRNVVLGGTDVKPGFANAIVLDGAQFELRVHSETRYAKWMRDVPMPANTVIATTGVWNAGQCGLRIARGSVIDDFEMQPVSLFLNLQHQDKFHPSVDDLPSALRLYAFFGQTDSGDGTRRFAVLPIREFGTRPSELRAGVSMPHMLKGGEPVFGGTSKATGLVYRFVIGIDDDSGRILLLVTFGPTGAITRLLRDSGIDHLVLPDGGGSTGIVFNERGLTSPKRFQWLARQERQTARFWKGWGDSCDEIPAKSDDEEDHTMTNYLLFIHRPTGP